MLLCLLLLAPVRAWAEVRYVDAANASPASPYKSWATAATKIQDAVDAAVAGDEIIVTNGVYQTGATAVYGMSNRVAVTKPVTVRSVNGPELTAIVGSGPYGDAAVRCVYLTNGAVLVGFTLTNGATQTTTGYLERPTSGGGVWCESLSAVLSNCVLSGSSAYRFGGGAYSGTLNNCTLTGNTASGGGGAYSATLNYCALSGNGAGGSGGGASACTLNHCTLTGNSTQWGGGAQNCTLTDCSLTGNSAQYGAGIYLGTLNNCTLTGNSGQYGSGAYFGTLNNCTLNYNSASWYGGGAYSATLNNCTLAGNSAGRYGGGAFYGTLNNCTLTGNSAVDFGGGASYGTLNNCVVYYNTATTGGNSYSNTLNYCCTTPLPAGGVGNTDAEPQLASASHLSAVSPCRGLGNAAYAGGLDIDGEPWASPPAVGCDEYWSGSITGALSTALLVSYTNVAVGFGVDLQALIGGRVSASRWEFGDGLVVSNRPWTSHAWLGPGDYIVELRAYNESYPDGIAASVKVHVSKPVHYVAPASADPVPPYDSWATAATNIQDAVDAATVAGALVSVTNGVYQTGARAVYRMTNRVAVTKPVMVRSVNGPTVTAIVGSGPKGSAAVRCVYLTNGATLVGFTLTNGATQTFGDLYRQQSGGGVWCEPRSASVSNCVLADNSASQYGGAAYYGTLSDCTITDNSAQYGGGAYYSTLNNCTLAGNSALQGGGADYGTLNNCIAYYNAAPAGGNYYSSTLNYCCTTPLPDGEANFTNPPLFLATNRWSNLRLHTNSPCINAGLNDYAPGATDLDGRPRIIGGTVDIGAYEFQGPGMGEFISWLRQYGLPSDGTADFTDLDHDGLNNWQEWQADTNPTNKQSLFRIETISVGPPLAVQFLSSSNRLYTLHWATNLTDGSWVKISGQSDVPGSGGLQGLSDPNAVAPGFYRVSVRLP